MGRTRQPIKHGTYAGVKTHRRRGEAPCDACLAAEREYVRERRRKISRGEHVPVERSHAECGTQAGYFRHYRKGEKACKRCRAAHAEAMREYRKSNPYYVEQDRRRSREYAKRPEVRKRFISRLAEKRRTPGTPEYYRYRAYSLRYSAARRGADTTHGVTRTGLAGKLEFWGGRCWLCRIELDETNLTFDHVKPISKGGLDVLSNLRPCCRSCNARKSNRWPLVEVTNAIV